MSKKSSINSCKPKPEQLEVQWPELESFALITQQTIDGERVAKEAAQRIAAQQASDQRQTQFQPRPIQQP